jgi:hypothetical protein
VIQPDETAEPPQLSNRHGRKVIIWITRKHQTDKGDAGMASKKKSGKARSKTKAKATAKGRKTKRNSSGKSVSRRGARRSRVRSGQISSSEKAVVVSYDEKGLGAKSGGQAGDMQGISDVEEAGSESVEELLEEGSAFEAEVLQGVERAADRSEKEVRTRETLEDDVPGEYIDQERQDRQ